MRTYQYYYLGEWIDTTENAYLKMINNNHHGRIIEDGDIIEQTEGAPMTLKVFYDSTTWRGFFPPEKPEKGDLSPIESVAYEIGMEDYEQAYAEAKANALEVGNAEVIKPVFWEMQSGAEYTWYGSAVIKDGKYILSV